MALEPSHPSSRSLPGRGGLGPGAPVSQLPAVRRGRAGVSRGEPGQDGALPLPVLDAAAFYLHGAGGPPPAQPGGEVWGGPAARQVRSQRHTAAGMGALRASQEVDHTHWGLPVPGLISGLVRATRPSFFCNASVKGGWEQFVNVVWLLSVAWKEGSILNTSFSPKSTVWPYGGASGFAWQLESVYLVKTCGRRHIGFIGVCCTLWRRCSFLIVDTK